MAIQRARAVRRATATYLVAGSMLVSVCPAHADWCETFPGSGVYTDKGCDKSGYGEDRKPTERQQPQTRDEDLREKLRKRLREGADNKQVETERQRLANQLSERIVNAEGRAREALRAGSQASDPQSRARYRSAYFKAKQDLLRAYDDATKASPGGKAEIEAARKAAIADLEGAASQSGLLEFGPQERTSATNPPRKLDPNVFVS